MYGRSMGSGASADDTESPRRGAPAGPRPSTLELVLYTAFQLLIAEGASAVTANRLHKETGVARTTIYRHWPQPSDIFAAMLAKATSDEDVAEFVGDLRADLNAAMDQLVFRFNNRPLRPLFGALVEVGRSDDRFPDIARDYVEGLVVSFRRAIDDAIGRGELDEGSGDALVAELTGPLFFRHVLLGETVTQAEATEVLVGFLTRHVRSGGESP